VTDRILVTGANGFVGSALCRHLVKSGFVVRGTVRDGSDRFWENGVEWVRLHDESSDGEMVEALRDIQAIVHLAARVHVMRDTAADPLREFRRVNAAWTERLADSAARKGVRRFVFMSSVKVNGERTRTPFTEQDLPSPQDPYGQSKWDAEQAVARIAARTGLETVVIRAPLVYGPEVGGNFEQLLKIVRAGIPLPLASVGNRRSLLFLGNLIDALSTCLADKRATGRTFLVSDGEDLSTPELIRRLGRAMGSTVRIWSVPPTVLRRIGVLLGRRGMIDRLIESLQVDSSLIRRELNWRPPFTVDTGFSETAAWYLSGAQKQRRSQGHYA